MFVLWFVVLLVLLLIYYYRCGYAPYQVFKRMGVPGPPPLPFLGNALSMWMNEDGMDIFGQWANKYGPVCGFFGGAWPGLLVTDHNMLQQILITKFKFFSDRIDLPLLNSKMTGLPPGLFECRPKRWKHVRHITSPAFTSVKLRKMSAHVERSCNALLDRMVKESSTKHSINAIQLYKDFVLEVTIMAVLGQTVDIQRGEGIEFKRGINVGSSASHGRLGRLLTFLLHVHTQMTIISQLPWIGPLLHWLGPGRFLPTFRAIKNIIKNCTRERKKRVNTSQWTPSCVLDLLVADCVAGDQNMTEDEVVSHCLNFMLAAYDTTSFALICCSHLLATHPHVQTKLCDLLDHYWLEHEGTTPYAVAQDLPYLDMVVDETLRLYPPSPRIARVCVQATEVCGVKVPEGMNIAVPVHYLHSMKDVWGDPEVFRPERFEAEESECRPPCSFLPLGQGPRNCIGIKLARMMMKMVLVTLLYSHRFITTPDTVPVIQTKCPTLTSCPKSDVFLDIQSRSANRPVHL